MKDWYQNHFKTVKKMEIEDPYPLILRIPSVRYKYVTPQELLFICISQGSARDLVLGHIQNFILSYSNNLMRLVIFIDEEKGSSKILSNSPTVKMVVYSTAEIQT